MLLGPSKETRVCWGAAVCDVIFRFVYLHLQRVCVLSVKRVFVAEITTLWLKLQGQRHVRTRHTLHIIFINEFLLSGFPVARMALNDRVACKETASILFASLSKRPDTLIHPMQVKSRWNS